MKCKSISVYNRMGPLATCDRQKIYTREWWISKDKLREISFLIGIA